MYSSLGPVNEERQKLCWIGILVTLEIQISRSEDHLRRGILRQHAHPKREYSCDLRNRQQPNGCARPGVQNGPTDRITLRKVNCVSHKIFYSVPLAANDMLHQLILRNAVWSHNGLSPTGLKRPPRRRRVYDPCRATATHNTRCIFTRGWPDAVTSSTNAPRRLRRLFHPDGA